MCDTVVALGNATADGAVIFGKNSDREPNEAQYLVRIPAAGHAPGAMVKCTYLEIPQVERTFEVVLSKPFWIWGAEMGVNEHGVAIGNEAVFTRAPREKGPALTGMDLLRLALERSRTAREALAVITGLLETHGQGGNCGFAHRLFYDNSFLIADPREAFVLETAGRHWAMERVRDVRAISNGLTIGNTWDDASADLVSHAVARGWCRGRDDFDFSRCYSEPIYTRGSRCRSRQARAQAMLEAAKGRITVETIFALLRDHGGKERWHPAPGLANVTICWHAGFGPLRGTQTTGSLVSHLAAGGQTHFATGTAAPCTGVFKPFWTGLDLPETGPPPAETYDEASLFWRHEALHRAALRNFTAAMAAYGQERDGMEREFVASALALVEASPAEKAALMRECFARAEEAERVWLQRVRALKPAGGRPLHGLAWRRYNREAGLPGRES